MVLLRAGASRRIDYLIAVPDVNLEVFLGYALLAAAMTHKDLASILEDALWRVLGGEVRPGGGAFITGGHRRHGAVGGSLTVAQYVESFIVVDLVVLVAADDYGVLPAVLGIDLVETGAAVQDVAAAITHDDIVCFAAVYDVVAALTVEGIFAVLAQYLVVGSAAENLIAPAALVTPVDGIPARVTVDEVRPAVAVDRVRDPGSIKGVAGVRTPDRGGFAFGQSRTSKNIAISAVIVAAINTRFIISPPSVWLRPIRIVPALCVT